MNKNQSDNFPKQTQDLESVKRKIKSRKSNLKKGSPQKINNAIETLSYEDSLNALDEILQKLQADTVAVEDLQQYYLKGNMHLDHCERLLNDAEQKVEQIDSQL